MDVDQARKLMARPVPLALAARAFGVDPAFLAQAVQDGMIAMDRAFALARRHAEAALRAVRFARRSTYMKTRMAVQRAARAFVSRDRLALAMAALRRAVAAVIRDLEARLWPFAPRQADIADRAALAVLKADPIVVRRPTRRTTT